MIFLHVQKTGGTSIECAAQAWRERGWWTDMGHVHSHNYVQGCLQKCRQAGVPSVVVMTVRDPYSYWQSL